jgi:chromosome segregation ATPase
MYFGSGSVVAAANVLLVVALVVVALLVMPLIHDCAVRLIMRRFRGAAGSGARKTDIIAPRTVDQTLKARRAGAADQARASRAELAVRAKEVLSYEHSDKLMSELDKRSILIDAQKTEIIALKIQVETLEARLKLASNDRHVQNLENRLVEQSRRLNESEFELKYLRDEIEVAQKPEADLRRAIIEIDGHAKRATQNHEAEKAKLQAALDRANGERARLAYELAKMKQQAERTTPAEQGEDVMLRECIIDAESSGNGERAFLHQPLIESDEVKRCLARQSAATVLNRAAQADVVRAIALCRVVR